MTIIKSQLLANFSFLKKTVFKIQSNSELTRL